MALRKPILKRGWQQIVLIQAVGAKTLGHITNPTDCHAPVKNIYDLFCFYLRQTPCPATTKTWERAGAPHYIYPELLRECRINLLRIDSQLLECFLHLRDVKFPIARET